MSNNEGNPPPQGGVPPSPSIQGRKMDHIRISLEKDTQAKTITAGFEDIRFIHHALPELNFDDIDTRITLFGRELAVPIIISAMTGGASETTEINRRLATVASEYGLGMGLGSQRAAVIDPNLNYTYSVARECAPNNLILGNLGGGQLAMGWGSAEAQRAVDMIQADALAIHLNPLHEAIQPEGERNYSGVLHKIKELASEIKTPIVIKETGAGLSREVTSRLVETGIKGFEIAGAGGTSFSAVETHRAIQQEDPRKEHLGRLFWDWGIPSVASTIEVRSGTGLPIICSGGVRDGLAVAKALAIGAEAAGIAGPFLHYAAKPDLTPLRQYVERLILELKTTMFLVGAKNIQDLKETALIISGRTHHWLSHRGLNPNHYAKRKG